MRVTKRESGFTLLEVLVAVVILAIGLLGISRAQLVGFKSGTDTMLKTQAIGDLYTIADRLRANANEANLGASSAYVTLLPSAAAAVPSCSVVPTGCSQALMAENDLYEWWQRVVALPLGTGTLSFINNRYVITTTWDSDRSGAVDAGDTELSIVVRL